MSDEAERRQPPVSRRHFLGASGLATAGLLTGRRLRGSGDEGEPLGDRDVVVVGAGVEGLVTAYHLRRQGHDVLIVGDDSDATAGDGRQPLLVLEGHGRALELLGSLGLAAHPAGGGAAMIVDRTPTAVPVGALAPGEMLDREVGVALRRLNLMAAEVDPERPWQAANAHDRDATTLGAWMLDNVGGSGGRALFTAAVRATWGAEPNEISLLHALATVAGAGGVGPLLNATVAPNWHGPELAAPGRDEPGDRACRTNRGHPAPFASRPRADRPAGRLAVDGGVAALREALTAALGRDVKAGAAVARVSQGPGRVTVVGDGFRVRARRVVMALPTDGRNQITLDPALPAEVGAATQAATGDVVSVVAGYGALPSLARDAAVVVGGPGDALTWAEAGGSGSGATIVGYVCGGAARSWRGLPEAERRRRALDTLERWFGDRAGRPASYSEHGSRGAAGAPGAGAVVARPGARTALLGSPVEPFGSVHFAGSERADRWGGWLEGAMQAAERVAGETRAGGRRSQLVGPAGQVERSAV